MREKSLRREVGRVIDLQMKNVKAEVQTLNCVQRDCENYLGDTCDIVQAGLQLRIKYSTVIVCLDYKKKAGKPAKKEDE